MLDVDKFLISLKSSWIKRLLDEKNKIMVCGKYFTKQQLTNSPVN